VAALEIHWEGKGRIEAGTRRISLAILTWCCSPRHPARFVRSQPRCHSRGWSADSHQRVILARPRHALFPAKLCFISHYERFHEVRCIHAECRAPENGLLPITGSRGVKLRSLLSFTGPASVIDPCVGQGTALHLVTSDEEVRRYGVELDAERARIASANGIETIQGMPLTLLRGPNPSRCCI